ncbi:MAG TPA: helix-turn-helix domain-containing protein [Rhodanobacteraceae bacterium]|nr:helix-turn-helix domain-containing protein [Rhodanobacteraceae bacterium]
MLQSEAKSGGGAELIRLTHLVEARGPYRAGEYLFRQNEPSGVLFVVRYGIVKIRYPEVDGRECVGAFYLPGDVIGLRAIHARRFAYDAVALDTTYVCRYAFSAICALAERRPAIQEHLLRLLGRELHASRVLAAHYSAEERIAAFLVHLGERYARCGQSATVFQLRMSRADIGNYLRLATETVSRVLTRFRDRQLIHLKARSVELLALERLRQVGRPLLTY